MEKVLELEKVEINLPKDVLLLLRSIKVNKMKIEEEIKIALAIDLFTAKIVSVAKATEIAGMQKYDFMTLLNSRGIPVYEYTEREYQEGQQTISKIDLQKIQAAKRLTNMNLPVDDWEKMEEEIEKGAIE